MNRKMIRKVLVNAGEYMFVDPHHHHHHHHHHACMTNPIRTILTLPGHRCEEAEDGLLSIAKVLEKQTSTTGRCRRPPSIHLIIYTLSFALR